MKKFKIRDADIKNISLKLKEKKLDNIYSGRKLSLIVKKLEDGSTTIVNFLYPINNTTSVEVRKFQNDFKVKVTKCQIEKYFARWCSESCERCLHCWAGSETFPLTNATATCFENSICRNRLLMLVNNIFQKSVFRMITQ